MSCRLRPGPVFHLEWLFGRLDLSVALAFWTGENHDGISGHLCLPLASLYWGLDGVLRPRDHEGDRRLSLACHDRGVYWTVWRSDFAEYSRLVPRWRRGSFLLPWAWEHVRHEWLRPDGSVFRAPGKGEYDVPPEITETHPYTYVLASGKIQERTATINGEEREWRWRWFTWLPWPRMIRRSIDVRFSDEVGERSGSWKGGCIGCSYEWRHGESMLDALRRMERERKF